VDLHPPFLMKTWGPHFGPLRYSSSFARSQRNHAFAPLVAPRLFLSAHLPSALLRSSAPFDVFSMISSASDSHRLSFPELGDLSPSFLFL